MTRKWWVLFVGVVLQMVANPCVATQPQGYLVLVNTFAVLTIIYRLSERKMHFIVSLILGVPLIIQYWVTTGPFVSSIFFIIAGALYLYALVVCAPLLLHIKKVGWDELLGAIALYLLIGMTWAILYQEIEFFRPGSFARANTMAEFVYFSFTTLTTLGYGDITPISCEARVLTSLEAVLGVFCLAIVVARLISSHGVVQKN